MIIITSDPEVVDPNDPGVVLTPRLSFLARTPFATGAPVPITPKYEQGVYDFGMPRVPGRIVYAVGVHNSVQDLYSVPFDGGSVIDLQRTDYNYVPGTAPVAPDASGLLIPVPGGIEKVALDGSGATMLVEHPSATLYPSNLQFTHGADRLVYELDDPAVGGQAIFAVPVAGGPKTLAAVGIPGYSLKFSPDDTYAVRDQFGLDSFKLDGTQGPTNLYSGVGRPGFSSFSPDSTLLQFAVLDFTGYDIRHRDIYTVPVDGSAPPVKVHPDLPLGTQVVSYGFTPDGNSLLLRGDLEGTGTEEVFLASAAGGSAPLKLSAPLTPGTIASADGVTTDGHVVYTAQLAGESEVAVYSVPIGGGTSQKLSGELRGLYTSGTRSQLTPDRNFVLINGVSTIDGQEATNLYVTSAAGGEPVPLLEPLTDGWEIPNGYPLQFTPDGQKIVYRVRQNSDSQTDQFFVTGIPLAKVAAGTEVAGSVTGGAGFGGGIDFQFDHVDQGGVFKAEYFHHEISEVDPNVLDSIDFLLGSDGYLQSWDLAFGSAFLRSGRAHIHLRSGPVESRHAGRAARPLSSIVVWRLGTTSGTWP